MDEHTRPRQRDRLDEFFADPRYKRLGVARIAFERLWREGARVELMRLRSRIEAAPVEYPQLTEAAGRAVQFADGGPLPLNSDFSALESASILSRAQVELFIRLADGRVKYLVNVIRITEEWLAARCGVKQGRNAWGWINTLTENGLIEVIDHDEDRGSYDLRIHDPAPERSEEDPIYPQKPLPFPTDDVAPSGEGTGFSYGQNPAQISARSSAHAPPVRSSAQDSAQNCARNSWKKPSQDSPACPPSCENAQNSARSSAHAPMNTNEDLHSKSSMPQGRSSLDVGSLGSMGRTVSAPAPGAADHLLRVRAEDFAPRPGPTGCPGNEFEALRVTSALTDFFQEARTAFLSASSPKQQRETLRKRLNACVGLPADRDWWVAGKTAELVAAGRIELKRVLNLMATVDRRRALAPTEPYAIEKPEPWLQRAVAKLCNEHKVPFAKTRVVQEAEAVS